MSIFKITVCNSLKVLVGNKCDLERDVPKEDIQKLCAEYRLPYFEVSAKSGDKIHEPFEFMAKLVKKQFLDNMADSVLNMRDSVQPGQPQKSNSIKLTSEEKPVKSGCC